MNEEFCDGVKILLSRMESNPEEFGMDKDKWRTIFNQVIAHKEKAPTLPYPNYIMGLTTAEIDALYAGYSKFLRKSFDNYVMKEVLAGSGELSQLEAKRPKSILSTHQIIKQGLEIIEKNYK
jgi:hypothetical protein